MNEKEIINSGLIEGFVLGILDPDEAALVQKAIHQNSTLLNEVEAVENALQNVLKVNLDIKSKEALNIQLDFIEAESLRLHKGEFGFITKNSDASLWRKSIDHLLPKEQEPFFITTLRDDHQGELFLVRTYINVENEVHENEIESFMVIDGSCTCYIGDKVYNLFAGDYIEIPLYTNHDVKVSTKEPVIAIMQRLKLKAA